MSNLDEKILAAKTLMPEADQPNAERCREALEAVLDAVEILRDEAVVTNRRLTRIEQQLGM